MRKGKRSDLTAYARIRNSALRLFGERGVAAPSIRAVAKAAGVSPGLVQHYFRSKRALEAAVSAYVEQMMEGLARAQPQPGAKPGVLTLGPAVVAFIRDHPQVIAYLRRMLLQDGAGGRRLFDSIFDLSCALNRSLERGGLLRRGLDPVWTPLNSMILVLGPLLLEPAINRYLDHPLRTEAGLARWDAAIEDLYLHGTYRKSSARKPPSRRLPGDHSF
jgi:AcrR family transcriptional regulator